MAGYDSRPAERASPGDKRLVTLIGAAVNLPLGLVKVVVGYWAQSQALLADGIHALSDLISDAVVLVAVQVGSRDADTDHPYGHGRFETLGAVAVGALLLAAAGGLAVDAGRRLVDPGGLAVPGPWALVVALASLGLKEGLYHYTRRVARRSQSEVLRANAWHHRSDALSSLVAVVGLAGAQFGLAFLDGVAAIVIAAMLAKIALDILSPNLRELVDTGLGAERVGAIRDHIATVDGVKRVRHLRTRTMGPDAYADVDILVAPTATITEAHRIAEAVRARLLADIAELADISIHIEPAEHADAPASHELPLRQALMAELAPAFADLPGSDRLDDVRLHYLGSGIVLEVVLPWTVAASHGAAAVAAAYRGLVAASPAVEDVWVHFRAPPAPEAVGEDAGRP